MKCPLYVLFSGHGDFAGSSRLAVGDVLYCQPLCQRRNQLSWSSFGRQPACSGRHLIELHHRGWPGQSADERSLLSLQLVVQRLSRFLTLPSDPGRKIACQARALIEETEISALI